MLKFVQNRHQDLRLLDLFDRYIQYSETTADLIRVQELSTITDLNFRASGALSITGLTFNPNKIVWAQGNEPWP